MMPLKCCTPYTRKFGKLSSGHRTGKDKFLFQSQRMAMPKSAQTAAQLHLSHTLVKSCSKFSKPGFNNTWTVNFQMFKLVLEKAEELKIKSSQHPLDHWKTKRSRKHLFLLYWLCQIVCVDHSKLWKILKEMGIPDHLTCLLRNLYAGQEATVRTGHETTDWFQIGKGVRQGCILSPCLFNLYAEYIMRNAGLKKHKLESRFLGEISITSDTQMTPPLWQKVKRN